MRLPDLNISFKVARARITAEVSVSNGKGPCLHEVDEGFYRKDSYYLLNLLNKQVVYFSSICLIVNEHNISKFISMKNL